MSEERTPELLPCPFCGNTSLELTNIHDLEDCGNFDTDDCPCEKYENPGACGYYTVVCNFRILYDRRTGNRRMEQEDI